MITWHARAYNLRKYRLTTAYRIKLGKSGTRRSPESAMPPMAGKNTKRHQRANLVGEFEA